MRRIFSTTLLALGLAGLLRAAETAPAATTPASAPNAAPAGAAQAAKADSARGNAATAPGKKSARKPTAGARAAADSAAKADSLRAAATADSLKAAQAKAVADSAQAVQAARAADSLRADSTRKAEAQARAADSSRTAAADSAAADSAASRPKKRKRVVRETTVNTIDELKGKYRSPKKAMFMSLVVPGLGQAYVGHSWFNYTRGAVYFLTDVALAYGWHYYVGTKQDREIRKYQAFADSNWRQWKYEDSVEYHKDKSSTLNPHRASYCEAVQGRNSKTGEILFQGCSDPTKTTEYTSFKNEYQDTLAAADVGRLRADFPNAQQFYEIIGKENEFITGWLDAPTMKMGDSAWYAVDSGGNVLLDAAKRQVLATTPDQQTYIAMRAQANDYARMQAWFLGGMVVNHIVSAIDAALTARSHNKELYQTETSWYDRIRLDSRIAWEGLAPAPSVTASFTF